MGSLRVVPERPRGVALVRVHLREAGAVHDQIGPERRDRAEHRVVVADVELSVWEPDHLMMAGGGRDYRGAETTTRAGDDDLHTTPCGGRGLVTTSTECARESQSRCSRYHSTVPARPSSNGIDGRHPSPSSRSAATP